MPSVQQPDLFAAAGVPAASPAPSPEERPRPAADELNDAALIAAIPGASLADCHALAAEAGRRRLTAAIPALEALCRRFKGFGLHHPVPEQVAAVIGLAACGGHDAAAALARIIVEGVVQGPGLANAVAAAAELRTRLPPEIMEVLLRHAEPAIRADACRCAQPQSRVISLLTDLLNDLHGAVASAAACALGHMGRIEARRPLRRLLREDPTAAVIAATAEIADADDIVQLGRIARTRPDLAGAAIDALKDIDDPRAEAIIDALPASCQHSR
jgi:HEAT repeats